MTATIHHSYEVIPGALWFQLVQDEDALGSEVWYSRVFDGADHDDGEAYADRFQAMAAMRAAAWTMGKPIPYEAPVFEEQPVPEDPARTAGDVFWDWHNRLRLLRTGSPEADALIGEMERDQEFRDNSEAIFNITPKTGNSWSYAAIRSSCMRVAEDNDRETAKALNDIPTYGLF